MALEVRCPNCGTDFVLGNGDSVSSTNIKDGIAYLVPKTIRNENKTATRLEALKIAGVNVDKLQSLMQTDSAVKQIFNEDYPILKEISKGGFIRNPELFRRFITAQTWSLICNNKSWTESVRERYNINYVFRQTKQELGLQIKLMNKGVKASDKRFYSFSFEYMINIILYQVMINQKMKYFLIFQNI